LKVGDGTTSVVLLAGEFLKQSKPYIEEAVHPQVVIKAFRRAAALVSHKTKIIKHSDFIITV
jgi:T-complex protein 1 subunit eta